MVSMRLDEEKKRLARAYADEETRLEKLGGSVKRLSGQASDARTRGSFSTCAATSALASPVWPPQAPQLNRDA